jgi:two-component system, chemotaxis family, sensor kinase CheA
MAASSYGSSFVTEARDHIAAFTAALLELERPTSDTAALVEELFRRIHSVKGGAGLTGFASVQQVAKAMESALDEVRQGRASKSPQLTDRLLQGTDRILELLDQADTSKDADVSATLQAFSAPEATDESAQTLVIDASPSDTSASAEPVIIEAAADLTAQAEIAETNQAATADEFPFSDDLLRTRPGGADHVYGVKFDFDAGFKLFGVDPLEATARLDRVGSVLRAQLDPPPATPERAMPAGAVWYRAIVASPLSPDEFVARLDLPFARTIELRHVRGGNDKPSAAASAESPKPAAAPASKPRSTTLRVSVPLIDQMMALAGELVLVRNQAKRGGDIAGMKLRDVVRRLDSVTNELQGVALRMRMQPVANLFDTFPRLVRDLARQLGKQIELKITGSEVELDKTILEQLTDPLTHLVRNSCDHGVEPPDARIAAGKSGQGTIHLSASQQRGQIVISIADDGKGIDLARVRAKAVERGMKKSEELNRMDDREIQQLILLPGFSTAQQVTDVSGRGVGMDVVKTNIDQLGGSLEIDSRPGEGTTFTLRLPLTLAILPGLLIASGDRTFALPQRDVEEILSVRRGEKRIRIEQTSSQEFVRVREQLIPLVRLRDVLDSAVPIGESVRAKLAHEASLREQLPHTHVVVMKYGSGRFAMAVDVVMDTEEIVAKPMHPLLKPLGIYSGVTILGDGRVALILSAEGIGRHAGITQKQAISALAPPKAFDPEDGDEMQDLLLLRYGPGELLAVPVMMVKRVLQIRVDQIRPMGNHELLDIDGVPTRLLRPDQWLELSPAAPQKQMFVIIPRNCPAPVGLLVSEVVDSRSMMVRLETRALRADGILGTAMIGQQMALFLDLPRLIDRFLQQSSSTPMLAAVDKRQVLVVDDTQFFRQIVKTYLEQVGFDVRIARNGEEGWRMIQEHPELDLVVSDLEMPVMDGWTLARTVRGSGRSELRMMSLSTLAGEDQERASRDAGFDLHEVKLDRDHFLRAVQQLLTTEVTP